MPEKSVLIGSSNRSDGNEIVYCGPQSESIRAVGTT